MMFGGLLQARGYLTVWLLSLFSAQTFVLSFFFFFVLFYNEYCHLSLVIHQFNCWGDVVMHSNALFHSDAEWACFMGCKRSYHGLWKGVRRAGLESSME